VAYPISQGTSLVACCMSFCYREQYTRPPLAEVIRKFWVMDNARNPAAVRNKSVLPNSCFNLAFVAGGGMDIHNRRGQLTMPAGVYFCGQARRAVDVVLLPFTHVTMVQLHPWTPARLDSTSLADTADVIVPLGEVLSTLYEAVQFLLLDHETPIISFFQTHFARYLVADEPPLLRRACQRFQQTKGALAVGALAEELGCSTRLLEKQFRQYLGLTPKEFTTVLRVRGVVDALQTPGANQALAQVALEYGFYDQAHFIHAFRKMVQFSPGKFNPADYMLPLTGTGY